MGKVFACWTVWLGLTLTALAFVVCQAASWSQIASSLDASIVSPHRAVPAGGVFWENDTPTWLAYARRIADGETWRVRFTYADNAPFGREVHWSQSVSWLLVFLARIRQWATGEGIQAALEGAAVWLNPLLHALLIASLGFALFRRVGVIPAGLFALYAAASANLGVAFHALRPDHQSLHCFFGAWTMGGILLGGSGRVGRADRRVAWIKPLDPPDLSSARKWFLVSGVAAGFGLWVSATVQGILMLLIFAAAFFPSLRQPSSLWRRWGWAAGLTSLAFYFLEYFPGHLALRFEVNGPWYSFTAIAMGEALSRRKHRIFFTGLVALLPLAILFGPASWHALRDPHIYRIHQSIEEFLSFPRMAGPSWVARFFRAFGLLPAFFLLALWRWRASVAVPMSAVVACGLLALAFAQVRWLGLADLMTLFLAVAAGLSAWQVWRGRLWLSITVAILLGLQPVLLMADFHRYIRPALAGAVIPQPFVYPLMAKRIALAFRDLAGPGARVMASPSIAPALQYFAGASVVSSLYWENRPGIEAGFAFLSDTEPEGDTARRIARERGLTHILLLPEKPAEEGSLSSPGADGSHFTLSERLAGGLNPPTWTVVDDATRWADSQAYTFRGRPMQARCRIYKIIVPDK